MIYGLFKKCMSHFLSFNKLRLTSAKVRTSITLKRECLDRMSIFSYFCNNLIGEGLFFGSSWFICTDMIQILVIDDEDPIRNLLARMIELEGYKVWKASDCQSALKLLKAQPFDVVLCDVFLPDGNGVDFIREIKKHRPEAEVILLTAHGNIPDGVQAIKNGAFDYITKGDDTHNK